MPCVACGSLKRFEIVPLYVVKRLVVNWALLMLCLVEVLPVIVFAGLRWLWAAGVGMA
jgi:hypothetical protein